MMSISTLFTSQFAKRFPTIGKKLLVPNRVAPYSTKVTINGVLKNTDGFNITNYNIKHSSKLTIDSIQKRFYAGASAPLTLPEIEQRVLGAIQNFYKITPTSVVTVQSHFSNDLGLDSLDSVELILAMEDEFSIEIPDSDAEKIQTASDIIKYILAHPHAK